MRATTNSRPDNRPGNSPLDQQLLRSASIEEITRLIRAGANPNAQTTAGTTKLHLVSRAALADQARRLLELGADVNARDNHGATPLHHAMPRKYSEEATVAIMFEQSMRKGHISRHLVDRTLVRLLVDQGADVNARDDLGRTPLHYATSGPIVQFLLESGADPTIEDTHGLNALTFLDADNVWSLTMIDPDEARAVLSKAMLDRELSELSDEFSISSRSHRTRRRM